MGFLLVPPEMQAGLNGHAGFQDRGLAGMGVPGYTKRGRNYSYMGNAIPNPMGARYFPPEPKYDSDTDNPVPIAAGYKHNGGRPAYRQRVYNAAKKDRKKLGFTRDDIDALGPDGYGPDWTARKVA